MILDKEFLDGLQRQAAASPRLRMNYDLRTSADDSSQRMLNALEPGTVVPVHRHRNSAETLVMVRGRICQRLYSDNGELTDEFEMTAGGGCSVLQIPAGKFHSLECLESGTVIFEAKDGAYSPLDADDMLSI